MSDLIKKSTDDFMVYASAVIKARAIPDVEDGLKPVNRRILYMMARNKIWSSKKHVKVNKVVGDVMGILHPHGDASINDALVRLSQDWKMRYPLIDIHGNNGTVGGDPAAAGRYIECRLTPMGETLLENTTDGIVPFVSNYDDTDREPVVLGGIFPNVLCNGTEGIAVGMSCGLVPHNLTEVCNLLVACAENKISTTDEAMNYLCGPDFPLGGTVIDGYKLRNIYETGQGSLTLRAKAAIKGNRISFTEFPYNVNVETQILKSIKSMKIDDEYNDIEDVENHIGKDSCSITVVLKKTADPVKVLKDLYEKTLLEKTIKINQTIIYHGIPMTLNLLGLCRYYLHHQHEVFINRATLTQHKAEHVEKINEGYKKAILNIDNTIRIVRESANKDIATASLINTLNVDEEQAKAILTLQLGRLTKMDVHEIEQKIQEALDLINEQKKIINNTKYRTDLICKALAELRSQCGDKRRTTIIVEEPREEKIVATDSFAILLNDGTLINVPTDDVENVFKKGSAYAKYIPMKISYCAAKSKALILNSDGTTSNSATDVNDNNIFIIDSSKDFIVTISKEGRMKKTTMESYKKFDKLCAIKTNDGLAYAFCCNEDEQIAVLTHGGKGCAIAVRDIKTSSKLTMGGKQADGVEGAALCTPYLYSLSADGHIKRFLSSELTSNNALLGDSCIKIGSIYTSGCYYNGKMNIIKWNDIAIKSKGAIGAKLGSKSISAIA